MLALVQEQYDNLYCEEVLRHKWLAAKEPYMRKEAPTRLLLQGQPVFAARIRAWEQKSNSQQQQLQQLAAFKHKVRLSMGLVLVSEILHLWYLHLQLGMTWPITCTLPLQVEEEYQCQICCEGMRTQRLACCAQSVCSACAARLGECPYCRASCVDQGGGEADACVLQDNQ